MQNSCKFHALSLESLAGKGRRQSIFSRCLSSCHLVWPGHELNLWRAFCQRSLNLTRANCKTLEMEFHSIDTTLPTGPFDRSASAGRTGRLELEQEQERAQTSRESHVSSRGAANSITPLEGLTRKQFEQTSRLLGQRDCAGERPRRGRHNGMAHLHRDHLAAAAAEFSAKQRGLIDWLAPPRRSGSAAAPTCRQEEAARVPREETPSLLLGNSALWPACSSV